MNTEKLFLAIGDVLDTYLEECENISPDRKHTAKLKPLICVASVILFLASVLILPRIILGSEAEPHSALMTTAPDTVIALPSVVTAEVSTADGKTFVLPLPREYSHLCTVSTDRSQYGESTLAVICYTPEYEISGYGDILRIYRYSSGEYERNYLDNKVFNLRLLGTDGTYYYVMGLPSDVTVDPTNTGFPEVNRAVCETVSEYFAEFNGLEFVDANAFFDSDYTYSGEHKFIRYYPYGKGRDYYYTLVLSQPAKKGDGGIWCVERWYDDMVMITEPGSANVDFVHGDTPVLYYHFPQSGDLSAVDYYCKIQEEYDTGDRQQYGDPLQTALEWVISTFSHDFAAPDMFETVNFPVVPQ